MDFYADTQWQDYQHFTIEPGKRGGKPCIRHMRITVSADKTRVEYVSCRLPVEKSGGGENGRIADSYVIAAP